MNLQDYEDIEKIIKSAVERTHNNPSARTLEMFEEINTKLDNHINSKDGQLLEIRDILKEQNKKIDPLYEVLVAGRGAKTIAYIVTTLAALTASIIYLKNVLWTK